ncbi:MAG: DNA polymerase I [Candidatus Melainabacteria bacterium]|nr:MAG: DNA polymerase I [Candidatus Melainabacteria bacterium]
MEKNKTLVLVDGSSLAFRSFFALFTTGLRTKGGEPTWAILGFFNSLFELIEKYKPEMLAVCFDLSAPTFRHEEFKDYKAHRTEMPDDLKPQWERIKQGVQVLGLPVYEVERYEADDLIGTIARQAEGRGMDVLILTGDQDAFQLVDGHGQQIKVLMPGKGGLQLYGREEVHEKLGIWPEQVIDYKGLCGDTSDNIPGVRGIGPKTAVQLLSQYKTMEGIYAKLDDLKSKSVKEKLTQGHSDAFASKKLATISLDAPVQFDFDHCLLTAPSLDDVKSFFSELEFKSTVARLPKLISLFKEVAPGKTSRNGAQLVAKVEIRARIEAGGSAPEVIPSSDIAEVQLTLALNASSGTATDSGPDIAASFDWQIADDDAALDQLVEQLKQTAAFAFNVQSTGESWMNSEIYGYSFAFADGLAWHDRSKLALASPDTKLENLHIAYVPIKHSQSGLAENLRLERVNAKLASILADANIGKVVHNAKQTANILSTAGLTLRPIVFDPMLASYVVSPDEKQGLRDQANRLFHYTCHRATDPAAGARKQIDLARIPASNIAEYGCDDARLSLELTRYYLSTFTADQERLVNDLDLPLSKVLAKMEQAGIALDLPYLSSFSRELESEIQRRESEIFKCANHPFNINSTQQLGKVLFEELGLTSKVRTKTGFSTDASVLEALKSEHPIIDHILEYRQLAKLRSTYVDALPKLIWVKDGRLHGEFNQTTTSTGRLSSTNPNLQNIPIRTEMGRRMRRAFIPGKPGHILMSADYSQIELRFLAHMSEDKTLIDAFSKDQDVHARTAGEIFDLPIGEVTADMRRIGKTLNFALVYQQGPYATSQQLGITTKQASAFIEKYFSRYANVRAFLDETIAKAKQTGYVETLWKRRRYFRYLNDRNDVLRRAEERAACNAPLQGSAADLMRLAMNKLDENLGKHKLNAKLILQVHDELVLEVPETEVEETKEVVVESMLLGQPLKVPLRVDVGVAGNWMEAK